MIGIICISLSSCSIDIKPTKIKDGFSEKLLNNLEAKYKLRTPKSAEFISGYYDNSFRDASIYITFKVPQNEFESLFINNWDNDDLSRWSNTTNKGYKGVKVYNGEMYTALFYFSPVNGKVLIDFIARYPIQ